MPSPAASPLRNSRSEMAAMPVEAPDARNSAPMSRASRQNGSAVALRSTPVYEARKKPKMVPIRLSLRRRAARLSSGDSDSAEDTNAKSPNTPSIQAPIDIGSQNLKLPSMFRKRLGVPRSRISSMPQMPIISRARM